MKRYYTTPLLLLFLLPSLLKGQRSVYDFPFKNSERLLPMETVVNMDEISASYQTLGSIYITEITGLGDETMEQTSTSYISDPLVVDAVRMIEYYMKDQLIAPGEPVAGTAELSVIYFNQDNRMNLGSAFAVLTFGISALLGVTTHTSVTDVEIELRLFDPDNLLITSQRGAGRGKKWVNLYSLGNSGRKAHQKAIKEALETVNVKTMEDPATALLKTSRSTP